MTLIEELRNPIFGWSGDASCVSDEVAARAANEIELLHARLALAGKYLEEIRDHGNDWGSTACSAHAFLALGNAIHPKN